MSEAVALSHHLPRPQWCRLLIRDLEEARSACNLRYANRPNRSNHIRTIKLAARVTTGGYQLSVRFQTGGLGGRAITVEIQARLTPAAW